MKNSHIILEFNDWVSSTTANSDIKVNLTPDEIEDTPGDSSINYSYKSTDKTFYGIKKINLFMNGKSIFVNAKFDTGARTSSLDISSARKLGVDESIINATNELEKIKIDKNITKKEEKKITKDLEEKYKKDYPGISSVQFIKSASGFSVRLYVKMVINYDGRIIHTEVNIKDRKGMKAEMLIGLKDML